MTPPVKVSAAFSYLHTEMHRRHFIRQSGLLSGALFGGTALLDTMNRPFLKIDDALTATNKRDNDGPLRVGIVGCGDRGIGILKVMQSMPEAFSFVRGCDILDFRLERTRQEAPNGLVGKDYRSILDDKQIDAVVIATPIYLHFSMAKAALEAGKHVYLEKTMTFTIPEARQLEALAARHNRQVLQVGHQYRYTPLYFKVKEMIDKGYLGKVTQIDCRWDRNWNWRRAVPQGYSDRQINWRMYREYSGGLAAELLSHQIDFVNWAFNTHPDRVMATGGIDNYKDGRETFDNLQAVLRYDQAGMIGNFGATCANAHEGYIFKIKGTKGMVSLLMDEGIYYPEKETRKELETVDGVTGATKIEWNKDGGIPILKEKAREGTWYALKEFYECVRKQTQPVSNVTTGATTATCVSLINEAAYSGTTRYWKRK